MFDKKFHGSFIKMPSKKVREMAAATLEKIRKSREEEYKSDLEHYRQEMMKGFWHRLLKKPAPTDVEVIAWHDKVYYDSFGMWSELRYGNQEAAARRLHRACEEADEIYISTEDLSQIQ